MVHVTKEMIELYEKCLDKNPTYSNDVMTDEEARAYELYCAFVVFKKMGVKQEW